MVSELVNPVSVALFSYYFPRTKYVSALYSLYTDCTHTVH